MRPLTPEQVAAELRKAAEAIHEAAEALDRAAHSTPGLLQRIEAIKGQDSIDTMLAKRLSALADKIDAEVDADLAALDEECRLADAAVPAFADRVVDMARAQ